MGPVEGPLGTAADKTLLPTAEGMGTSCFPERLLLKQTLVVGLGQWMRSQLPSWLGVGMGVFSQDPQISATF